MKYTVEYGKINCNGWGMERFDNIEDAKQRFNQIVEMIKEGVLYATTAILSEEQIGGPDVWTLDFFSTDEESKERYF